MLYVKSEKPHRKDIIVTEEFRLRPGEEVERPPATRAQTVNRKTRQSRESASEKSEVANTSSDCDVSSNWSYNTNRVQNLNRQMLTRSSRQRRRRTVEKQVDRQDNVSQPVPELAEIHESDVGHSQSSHVSEETERVYSRHKRIKPPVKLSYSDFGKSKDPQLTIVHRGMVVHIKDSPEWKKQQYQTLWCHPMAKCFSCASSSPAATLKKPLFRYNLCLWGHENLSRGRV